MNYISESSKRFCTVCESKDTQFHPLPDFYLENARQYGFEYFEQAETLSLKSYTCANCGASDRERLYALWIQLSLVSGRLSVTDKVIHFAPEAALSENLKTGKFKNYNTADFQMKNVDYKVDIMSMPFQDGCFDFFICSHVLEHVESDDQAIKELHRITRMGGCGILMAPVIIGLKNTLEDSNLKEAADRWRVFGQDDHVRLYAHDDYVNKIQKYGFQVEELDKEYFGVEVFCSLGISHSSILYVVSK